MSIKKQREIMAAAERIDCTIRRVRVNVVEAIKAMASDELTIDLMPGETLCPHCLGTGVRKIGTRFGTRTTNGFPYYRSYLSLCGACDYGRIDVCKHCSHTISIRQGPCQCKDARAERDKDREDKEAARIAEMRHVKAGECDYEWVMVGDDCRRIEDVLDEVENAEDVEDLGTVFACEETSVSLCPDAHLIIETMGEHAYDAFGEQSNEMLTTNRVRWMPCKPFSISGTRSMSRQVWSYRLSM